MKTRFRNTTLICLLVAPAFVLPLRGQTNVFPSSGAVGVGTISPQQPLHVVGSLRSDHSSTPGLYLYNGSTPLAAFRVDVANNILDMGDLYGSAPSLALGLYTADVERLRIDTMGNVGINTINPAHRLEVAGNTRLGAGVDYGTSTILSVAPGTIAFDAPGSPGGRLKIDGATGNVGIGMTNPSHKLAVNGTIKAKEVIVETTGWSDYVFADDYRLAPLSEVEAHIQAKKHLPGIPSAAEVEQGGVSLGDLQARMMAKIEELTLHVIAQSKRLDEQAARIATLEQENRELRTR